MGKFKNIGIVGLGLIGGSLALDIKRRKISPRVTGFSRRLATLKEAKSRGLIDKYFVNFEEGLDDLDFLVVATPVEKVKEYFVKISRGKSSLLFTDVASVKEKISMEALDIIGEESNFVPSHPIAGSEKSGLQAAKENLFEGRPVIITPCSYTREKNVKIVRGFWESLGAKVFLLSPQEHDRLIGLTSHMPHLAVYLLIDLLEKGGDREVLFRCLGSGFLDTTRIGKSNPDLWAEIFLANRENISFWLDEFEKALAGMKRILQSGSHEELKAKLNLLKNLRDKADEKK